jgi:hypothetical protein
MNQRLEVSTTCGSGWVATMLRLSIVNRTHPLPQVVLTR